MDRVRAIGLALTTTTEAAARGIGMPRTTLVGWLHTPEAEALRETARDQVAGEFWAAVQLGLESVTDAFRSDAPLRDRALAVGILYDKWALLTGGATARTGLEPDHRLVDDLSADERERLRDWITALPAVEHS